MKSLMKHVEGFIYIEKTRIINVMKLTYFVVRNNGAYVECKDLWKLQVYLGAPNMS